MAGTKRRSVRQAATRKRSVYVELDTDEEDFEAQGDNGNDDGEDDFAEEDELAHPPPQKRRKLAPRTRHVTRSKSVSKSSGKAVAKSLVKGLGRRMKRNTVVDAPRKEYTGPTDGKTPAWTTLPLEILRDIFIYASRPMHEQPQTAASHVDWLIKAARVCRAFAQPALEAYYISPSLLTTSGPHDLLDTLQMPKEKRYMDYNVKTKALSIDVKCLAYTAHNKPRFDLSTLVAELPQLQHLEIVHPVDEPPFRPVFKIQPWHYPPTLLENLQEHGHRLRSFRWNRNMIAADATELYTLITQTHLSKPFEYLSRLTVCDFNFTDSAEPSDPDEENTSVAVPLLATSIALLPSLKDLTFITCDIIADKFLHHLPKNLERLEITNCLELTSDMLQTFLAIAGSKLRELVLNHNISLNLAFLSSLKVLCPSLQVLKLDLSYFSERINSNDAEPLYDILLTEADTPTWPATLRHLELIHIQRCSAEAAQNLFRSLVDGAQDLPDLRTLVLHSHINIPWRDRAGFRDQWIERLRRVYLRDSPPPSAYLNSLRQWRLYRQAQNAGRGIGKPKLLTRAPKMDLHDVDHDGGNEDEEEDELVAGRLRLSHINISPAKPHSGDTDVYSDSSPDKAPSRRGVARRSRRVAEASQASSPEEAADSESDEEGNDESDWRKQPEKFVQGLCSVVDIRIDNQRPRENQFTEGDFLDSEVSGDEDWHEGADGGDGDEYAW